MPELDSEIWFARKTGRTIVGGRKVVSLLMMGEERPKMILIASNAPEQQRKRIEYLARLSGTPTLLYEEGSLRLGKAIHKPFFVSALAILDEGESKILQQVSREQVDQNG